MASKEMRRLANQFRKFRKRFHFTQTELGKLLGKSRDFVCDVENGWYRSIHPATLRLFYALKQRHEDEWRNKNARSHDTSFRDPSVLAPER